MSTHSLFYDEDPFGRIVDVHWKKEDFPPPRPAIPHYCGYYGWGNVVSGSLVPFGPHQYPPMVGLTSFVEDNYAGTLRCGGIYSAEEIPDDWIPEAVMGGYSPASTLEFHLSSITFTSNEIYFGPGGTSKTPAIFWTVPLAGGETYLGRFGDQHIFAPWIAKTLTFNYDWVISSGRFDLLFGLGFSRWVHGPNNIDPAPVTPQLTMGQVDVGSFSYTYDMKTWEWWTEEFTHGHHYTYENQWDLSTGGPVQLWFYHGNNAVGWNHTLSTDPGIQLGNALSSNGDVITWEVVAECGDAFGPGDVGIPFVPDGGGAPTSQRAVSVPEASSLVYPPLAPAMLERINGLWRALGREMPEQP